MREQQPPTEVICPACAHRFPLEATMVDHLEEVWRHRERATLKREMAPEIDARAQAKAQRLAAAQIREKDEELRDAQKQVSSLKSQVTRLQRRMPSGRAQELGILRQDTLADILSRRFPSDHISVTARGVAGGDVVLVVRGPGEHQCGSILIESKRAANWSKAWIRKLEDNRKQAGHTIGLIVSEVLPEDDIPLVQVEGVWVCTLEVLTDVVALLRQRLIEVASALGAGALRDDLKGQVYDYISSREFAATIESLAVTAVRFREEIEAERRAFKVKWNERERCVDTMVDDMAAIYGHLRGIGASIETIKTLELAPPVTTIPRTKSA